MHGQILGEGAAAKSTRGAVGRRRVLPLFISISPLRVKFSKVHQGLDVPIEAVAEHVQTMVLGGIPTKNAVRKSR